MQNSRIPSALRKLAAPPRPEKILTAPCFSWCSYLQFSSYNSSFLDPNISFSILFSNAPNYVLPLEWHIKFHTHLKQQQVYSYIYTHSNIMIRQAAPPCNVLGQSKNETKTTHFEGSSRKQNGSYCDAIHCHVLTLGVLLACRLG
jgi:hypothetical protein